MCFGKTLKPLKPGALLLNACVFTRLTRQPVLNARQRGKGILSSVVWQRTLHVPMIMQCHLSIVSALSRVVLQALHDDPNRFVSDLTAQELVDRLQSLRSDLLRSLCDAMGRGGVDPGRRIADLFASQVVTQVTKHGGRRPTQLLGHLLYAEPLAEQRKSDEGGQAGSGIAGRGR